MEIPSVLVSCAEAARYLGKTRATISSYIRQHRLTKRTIDGVTGILLPELVAYKQNPQGCGGTAPWESCYQHVVKD